MKKTMTKILVTILAAAMMVGAAAGCNGSGSKSNESAVPVSSAVSDQESSKESLTPVGSSSSGSLKVIDLKTVEKDKLKLVLSGKEDSGKYEELFVSVDDGTENGYAAVFIFELTDSKKISGGVVQGSVIPDGDKAVEGDKETSKFTIKENSGMSVSVTMVRDTKTNKTDMSFKDIPYVMHLDAIDDKDAAVKAIEEALAVNEENNPSANAALSTDAATIDTACKVYYSVVASGAIADEKVDVKADKLPDKNTDEATRIEMAAKCTIQGALEYNGLAGYGTLVENLEKMAVDKDGNIVAQHEIENPAVSGLKVTMTFEELGYGNDPSKMTPNYETEMTMAAILDNACKTYVASVVSGAVDAEAAKNVTTDTLPAASATEQERREAAMKLTIQGAMEYAGIDETIVDLSRVAAIANGTIVGIHHTEETIVMTDLSGDTTMQQLYGDITKTEDTSAESAAE